MLSQRNERVNTTGNRNNRTNKHLPRAMPTEKEQLQDLNTCAPELQLLRQNCRVRLCERAKTENTEFNFKPSILYRTTDHWNRHNLIQSAWKVEKHCCSPLLVYAISCLANWHFHWLPRHTAHRVGARMWTCNSYGRAGFHSNPNKAHLIQPLEILLSC